MTKDDFDELFGRIDEIEAQSSEHEIKRKLRALKEFLVMHYPEGE